jgi:hypothetical protein
MNKKVLILITAIVLVLSMVTGATLAYMFLETGTVNNTFVSGGFGTIYLKEDDGGSNPAKNWLSGSNNDHTNSYTVVPGVDINKDPQVRFTFNSNSVVTGAYIFVRINHDKSDANNGWTFTKGTNGANGGVNGTLTAKIGGKQAFTVTFGDDWRSLSVADTGDVVLCYSKSGNFSSITKSSNPLSNGMSIFKKLGDGTNNTIDVSAELTEGDIETLKTNQDNYDLFFSVYAVQKDGLPVIDAWNKVKSK